MRWCRRVRANVSLSLRNLSSTASFPIKPWQNFVCMCVFFCRTDNNRQSIFNVQYCERRVWNVLTDISQNISALTQTQTWLDNAGRNIEWNKIVKCARTMKQREKKIPILGALQEDRFKQSTLHESISSSYPSGVWIRFGKHRPTIIQKLVD